MFLANFPATGIMEEGGLLDLLYSELDLVFTALNFPRRWCHDRFHH